MPPKKVVEEDTSCARFGCACKHACQRAPGRAKTDAARSARRVKNNLKMGIVGLPNVGKSSLFNLLCEQACAAVRSQPPQALALARAPVSCISRATRRRLRAGKLCVLSLLLLR